MLLLWKFIFYSYFSFRDLTVVVSRRTEEHGRLTERSDECPCNRLLGVSLPSSRARKSSASAETREKILRKKRLLYGVDFDGGTQMRLRTSFGPPPPCRRQLLPPRFIGWPRKIRKNTTLNVFFFFFYTNRTVTIIVHGIITYFYQTKTRSRRPRSAARGTIISIILLLLLC